MPTDPTPDLDALAALAEKATPGPWLVNEEGGETEVIRSDEEDTGRHEPICFGHGYDEYGYISPADAAYIAAADPATILRLIADLRRVQDQLTVRTPDGKST